MVLDGGAPSTAEKYMTAEKVNLEHGSIWLMKSSDKLKEHALHLVAVKCNNRPLGPRIAAAEAWHKAMVSVYTLADQWFDKHGLHLFLLLVLISIITNTTVLFIPSLSGDRIIFPFTASIMVMAFILGASLFWFGGMGLLFTWQNWVSITKRKVTVFTV